MITVYSKPRCMQCAAIITHLSKQGIDYQVRDAEQHSEEIIQLGCLLYTSPSPRD